ncbi:MAG: peptidase S1 [Spirochaetales bacterium]|nr:peptidase S1 [Spirochaetales bacterium]
MKSIIRRLAFAATLFLAIFTLLTGCFTFSYSSNQQPPPEIPAFTRIDPSEPAPAPVPPDYTGLLELEKTAVKIYYELNRAVVNITSISLGYSWFFQAFPQSGTGSGSIIDQDGHVLTNYHVIKGAERLAVTLFDGSRYPAEVVGEDPENDLALVSFDPEGRALTTMDFGTSRDLQIGQMVLALGNPFGLERTLTTGIISGLDRPLQTGDGFLLKNLIQTDASINPGNSGGPLLDSNGDMIGINTMIISPSQGSVGIGFAVPADTAKRVIPDLKEYGRVRRGWIDIVPVPIYPSLAERAGLPVDYGILVSVVDPSGNAAQAGLRGGSPGDEVAMGRMTIRLGGDIIVSIKDTPVRSLQDYYNALEATDPGDSIRVEVIRDGDAVELNIKLAERPKQFGW